MRYVISAAIGAVIFVIVGYFVSGDGLSFGFWLERPLRYNVFLWALLGSAIGAGVRYAAR